MNRTKSLVAVFSIVFGVLLCCLPQSCQAKSESSVREIPITLSNADIDELSQMFDESCAGYVYLGQKERLIILSLADVLEKKGQKECVERIRDGYTTVSQRALVELAECVADVDGAEIITEACGTIMWCPLAVTHENERVILRIGIPYRTLQKLAFERSNFDDDSFSTCLLIPQEMFGEGGRLLDMPEIFVGLYIISGTNWNMTPSSISFSSIGPLNPALPITIEGDLKVTGATEFNDDIIISECNTLYADKIDPLEGSTTTSFSGDVAIVEGKILYVNEIDPLSGFSTTTFSGNVELVATKTLYTNYIDPLSGYTTTSFSGDVSIPESKKFYVHEINSPGDMLTLRQSELFSEVVVGGYAIDNTKGSLYVGGGGDGSSGQIEIGGGGEDAPAYAHFGGNFVGSQATGVYYGGPSKDDAELTVEGTVYVNKIDPVSPATKTEFSGDVEVAAGKTLYVNEIDPLSGYTTTSFSGDIAVNTIKPKTGMALTLGTNAVGGVTQTASRTFNVGTSGDVGGCILNIGTDVSSGHLYVGGGDGGTSGAGGRIEVGRGGVSGCQAQGYFWGGNPNTQASLVVYGDVSYLTLTNMSDRRIKENTVLLDKIESLDQVISLSPVQYNFVTTETTDLRYGFIAQEVETIMPEAVDKRDTFMFGETVYEDFLSIKQGVLITKLISAVQELTRRLEVVEGLVT
jgi:hypothetical protein